MNRFFKSRMFISVSLSVVLTFAFVFAIAYSSTTISTNVSTDGTLSVTGTSALTGAVTVTGALYANGGLDRSSAAALAIGATNATAVNITPATTIAGTLDVTGKTTLVNASTTQALTVGSPKAGVFYIGGYATTTGSNGNALIAGKLGIGASTSTDSTAGDLAVDGTATTTLLLSSSTGTKGACIQISNRGTAYKMYIQIGGGVATTTPSGASGYIAVWEEGPCQ